MQLKIGTKSVISTIVYDLISISPILKHNNETSPQKGLPLILLTESLINYLFKVGI